MNIIVIPCHPIVPNLHTLLASTLLKAGCSPWLFLTVVLSVASQWLRPASTFVFTWEGQQYTWENCTPGFYLKSFLLLTNLKKLI